MHSIAFNNLINRVNFVARADQRKWPEGNPFESQDAVGSELSCEHIALWSRWLRCPARVAWFTAKWRENLGVFRHVRAEVTADLQGMAVKLLWPGAGERRPDPETAHSTGIRPLFVHVPFFFLADYP